jgi:general L-amino acid transport system ATP-binding protein
MAAAVEMKSVNKFYGNFHALKDISYYVSRGEKIMLCGPSGARR